MEKYTLGETLPEKKFPTATVLIAVAVIVILAGAGFWYLRSRETTKIISGEKVTLANPNQVVSGFPASLFLENKAAVESSYSINYGNSNQPVLTYVSALSLADNIKNYKNYFSDPDWRILSDGSNFSTPFLYAVRKDYSQEANVVFASENGKVKVTVSVLNSKTAK